MTMVVFRCGGQLLLFFYATDMASTNDVIVTKVPLCVVPDDCLIHTCRQMDTSSYPTSVPRNVTVVASPANSSEYEADLRVQWEDSTEDDDGEEGRQRKRKEDKNKGRGTDG